MTNVTQNTAIESTLIETKTRKVGSGRKFNAAKYAITRAWEIAKNAAVAHNTSPLNVAQKGLVKPSEFFAEALRMAWVEAKAKQAKVDVEMYKLHSVPKKSLAKIINTIAGFVIVNSLAKTSTKDDVMTIINKGAASSINFKEELATAIFNTRFSTGAARSTNRHTLHAIATVAQTGTIPLELA